MKWIDEIVNEILKEYPNEEIYTCSCGLSTTGLSHIGNLRELIITYFINKELENRGKQTRLILSFDDFDRLKKVPYNIDSSFEKYIGMPNYSIPSPCKEFNGYAEYFENKVIKELEQLGIDMEYINQSEKYLSNSYNDKIILALNNKDLIFDIISEHKSQTITEEDKKTYYPIRLYCECCNKDYTTITSYNQDDETIEYECECGNKERIKIKDAKIKLKFNVDWPMRWNYEHVMFEPCGKGHAALNGALTVSQKINEQIFKQKSPIIKSYDFLNLKSNSGRMNKNSSSVITITDALEIMPKEMLLWLFLRIKPEKEMFFSLDDNIMNCYKEYEKFLLSSNKEDERIKEFLNIKTKKTIRFSDLIRYLPIANFNLDNLKKYMEFDIGNKEHLQKIKCATNWLKKYSNNKYWQLNKNQNHEYWNKMNYEEKLKIQSFIQILKTKDISEYEKFITKLKENNEEAHKFYSDFYNLVFGVSKGIPLKTIFLNYNIDEIIKLLDIKENNRNITQHVKQPNSILHLSDLHFDINDYKTEENLEEKWDMMIDSLKKNIGNPNYIIITGDMICFYNMKENYNMAYKFLNYLAEELQVSKEKILMCTGNHEHYAYGQETNNMLFNDFENCIKPVISEYSDFQKKLLGYGIESLDEMYYIKSDDLCDFFVINSLFKLDSNGDSIFLQDEKKINSILLNYKGNNKYKFIINHAPRRYNQNLYLNTSILDKFDINLCGHKHSIDNRTLVNINNDTQLISGNKDGFVDNINSYNIYDLEKDNIFIKKLIYKNDKWKCT